MSNSCAFYRPAGYTDEWYWSNYGPGAVFNNFKPATTTNPVLFDADEYGIRCLSFPTDGDTTTLFNQSQMLLAHTTAIANLQTQVTALTTGSVVQTISSERIEAEGLLFGAVLVAGCLIWGAKRLYKTLSPSSDES